MVSNSNNVIAEGMEVPNYEPINLTKSNWELSEGLISLCSKGPSFIPTPNTFDWRQLQSLQIRLEKVHFFQQLKQVVTLTKIQHCL